MFWGSRSPCCLLKMQYFQPGCQFLPSGLPEQCVCLFFSYFVVFLDLQNMLLDTKFMMLSAILCKLYQKCQKSCKIKENHKSGNHVSQNWQPCQDFCILYDLIGCLIPKNMVIIQNLCFYLQYFVNYTQNAKKKQPRNAGK